MWYSTVDMGLMYSTNQGPSGCLCGPAPELFCLITPVTAAIQKINFYRRELRCSDSQASEMSPICQLFGIYKEVCKVKLYFKQIFNHNT